MTAKSVVETDRALDAYTAIQEVSLARWFWRNQRPFLWVLDFAFW